MWSSWFGVRSRGKCIHLWWSEKLPAWRRKLEEPVSSGIKTRWILVGWCFITAASVVTSIVSQLRTAEIYLNLWKRQPQFPESSVSASADAKQVACGYKLRGLGHGLFKDLETWKLFYRMQVFVSHFQERGSVSQDESRASALGNSVKNPVL